MIKLEKPQLCFLQETKCSSDTLERILSKAWIGCQTVAVDASGASGGLAIAWDAKVLSLSDFHASHHFIQANFHLLGTNMHGLLSNVYFPQDARKKVELLCTIETLNSHRKHPLHRRRRLQHDHQTGGKVGQKKHIGPGNEQLQRLHQQCLSH